jgi:magnesium-transporting ATPase (P-type)
MNELSNLNSLLEPNVNQLDIVQIIFNFIVCMIMAFILRRFYINRSYSLSGKLHIGSIIPILSAIVFTVIVVVKSSLALSLGLVGALSIVRFRTPIKEPEELVYLFMAISLGLGYGAGYTLVTTILSSLTLFIIFLWLSNRKISESHEYNLIINWESPDLSFEDLNNSIKKIVKNLTLVRLERGPSNNTAVLLLIPNDDINLDSITSDLKKVDPKVHITFFEAKTNW